MSDGTKRIIKSQWLRTGMIWNYTDVWGYDSIVQDSNNNPGSNTPQNSSCMATYLSSQKLSK